MWPQNQILDPRNILHPSQKCIDPHENLINPNNLLDPRNYLTQANCTSHTDVIRLTWESTQPKKFVRIDILNSRI